MITDLQQSVFKRYYSDKHFHELVPTRWRQKSTGTDMEQNYATVTMVWYGMVNVDLYRGL